MVVGLNLGICNTSRTTQQPPTPPECVSLSKIVFFQLQVDHEYVVATYTYNRCNTLIPAAEIVQIVLFAPQKNRACKKKLFGVELYTAM
jgi:hypothetical protein